MRWIVGRITAYEHRGWDDGEHGRGVGVDLAWQPPQPHAKFVPVAVWF
jgi:hypothetical protein